MSYNSERNPFIDIFRGLGIILVVVGHVIGGLIYSPFVEEKELLSAWHRWIYLFHMPAFFFAAGLFAERSLKKSGVQEFVLGKMRALMYPYVLWGLIMWLVHGLTYQYTNTPFDPYKPVRMLYEPYAGYWFLYVLFILMVVFAVCWTSRIGKVLFLAGAVSGCLIDMACPEFLPSLVSAPLHYWIFFSLGIMLASLTHRFASNTPSYFIMISGVAGFAIMTFISPMREAYPFIGIIAAIMGITGLWGVTILFGRWGPAPVSRFLTLCGRYSLEIYLVHPLSSVLARLILYRIFRVNEIIPHVVIDSAAGVVIPLLVVWLSQKARFPFLFTYRKTSHVPVVSTASEPLVGSG